MFYYNSKVWMYKLIGVVVYTIIDGYICLGYLSFLQKHLSKQDNNFENTSSNYLSGLGIANIFMNIMSCHEFSKY